MAPVLRDIGRVLDNKARGGSSSTGLGFDRERRSLLAEIVWIAGIGPVAVGIAAAIPTSSPTIAATIIAGIAAVRTPATAHATAEVDLQILSAPALPVLSAPALPILAALGASTGKSTWLA